MDISFARVWRRLRTARSRSSSNGRSRSSQSLSSGHSTNSTRRAGARIPLDVDVLEDRTFFSATPLMLSAFEVQVQEDSTRATVKLNEVFTIDNFASTSYQVLGSGLSGIGGRATIDAQQNLQLEFPAGRLGETKFTVQGTNSVGQVQQLPIELLVQEVNDTPTAKPLANFTSTSGNQTVIDLWGAFADEEDADNELTYRLLGNSRPDLFSSVTWDLDRGKLILQHAAGKTGAAQLTISATDTGGLSVGAGTKSSFKVYDQIQGVHGVQSPDVTGMGLSEIALWTDWYFFEMTDGTYDRSTLDTSRFLEQLALVPADKKNVQIVVNIENDYYVNTPEGRNKFAEVFAMAQQARPDLNFGLYMYVPERSWYEPVYYLRMLRDQSLGFPTNYTLAAEELTANYNDWLARNALFRTAAVAPQYGGVPLANLLDTINVSLYTVVEKFNDDSLWEQVDMDATANRFTWDGPDISNGQRVNLKLTNGGYFTNGLSTWVDYYTVNVVGSTFQIATTPGGAPIDFGATYSGGTLHAGIYGPWSDPMLNASVRDWDLYAEGNIAEGRKFGKPLNAWISPSFRGAGTQPLDYDFFRMQLETLKPLADGVVIYEPTVNTATYHENKGWFAALKDFMSTLDDPASTVTIQVGATTPPPPPTPNPQAIADRITTTEDQPVIFSGSTLLANDVSNGLSLTANFTALPSNGKLEEMSGGRWRYTPYTNFSGTDTFSYRVFDGTRYSASAQVQLQVNSTNDAPVAHDDVTWLREDSSLRLTMSSLLANDTDPDGDALTWQLITGPTRGTWQQNTDGTFNYVPFANMAGVDFVQYRVSDGKAFSNTATIGIYVIGTNDAPVANADLMRVTSGQSQAITVGQILANDRDPDDDALRARFIELPTNGTLRDLGTGQWIYTPRANFVGTDQFRYVVSDGQYTSSAAVITLQVVRPTAAAVPAQDLTAQGTLSSGPDDGSSEGAEAEGPASEPVPVNNTPTAKGDFFRMISGQQLAINGQGVLANDSDADSDGLTAKLVTGPRNGTLTLNTDGTFVYRPTDGYQGIDSFEYRAVDARGAESLAQVVLQIGKADRAIGFIPNDDDSDALNWSDLALATEPTGESSVLPGAGRTPGQVSQDGIWASLWKQWRRMGS